MESASFVKRFAPAVLMGLLPVLVLGFIAYMGSFTRYIADDYCSAYWAQRFGLLRSVWHWYITWSGRFSAYAADWLVTLIGPRNVRFVPPTMLLVWLGATILAVRWLMRSGWLVSTVLSVMLLFAVFTAMPSIPQSFYWWNGMRSYTLPLILFTLFAAVYGWETEKLQNKRTLVLAGILSFFSMFGNAGLSDTYAVAQLGLLGILALLGRRNSKAFAVLGAGALGTALALAVIALAPGNAFREASFPAHPSLPRLFVINTQGFGALLWSMLAAPQKMLALVGALFGTAWAGYVARPPVVRRLRAAAIILAIGLLLSYGAMLPASWGLSEPGPSRNMSVPVFALVVSLMGVTLVSGCAVRAAAQWRLIPWVLAAGAVLALNASAIMGIQRAYAERTVFAQYAQKWDAEEAQILDAKTANAGTVRLVSWPNWAGLDKWSDHSRNWLNACAGGYYGIEIVGQSP